MSVIRIRKQKNFSIISNRHLNDPKLSWKAKGLLTYLLSKPDDWETHIKQLVKSSIDGSSSVYSGIKELKVRGYIEYVVVRDLSNKISKGEYFIYEDPTTRPGYNPELNQLAPENRDVEIPPPENNGNLDNSNPANPHPDFPHVENLDMENRDALLKTDCLPNTENDVLKEIPTTSTQEPGLNPKAANPSSFPSDDLRSLMALIPTKYRSPMVSIRLTTAIRKNHTISYLKSTLEYCIAKTKAETPTAFRNFLGSAIDNDWGAGSFPMEDQAVKDQLFLESRRLIPTSMLIVDSENGCAASTQVLKERNDEIVS